MFDRLTTLPHGLRVFVEALLYGLQHHWIEVGDRVELGADVDRYSFIVVDLHHLLLAGLPAHFESYMPSQPASSPAPNSCRSHKPRRSAPFSRSCIPSPFTRFRRSPRKFLQPDLAAFAHRKPVPAVF